MPDLDFALERIEVEKFSATPLLLFKISITQPEEAVAIHTIALRCQIRIDPARRKYSPAEEGRLVELFGRREQWHQTLRSMLWTHASTMVPAFTATTVADLPVPCTFDFNVAMTKYFDALEEGEVPVTLLFSGTVFYENDSGALQAAPISWEKEAAARLPVARWREMIDLYYPNTAWLCLGKQTFDRLRRYKTDAGHVTWERAIDALLLQADARAPQ